MFDITCIQDRRANPLIDLDLEAAANRFGYIIGSLDPEHAAHWFNMALDQLLSFAEPTDYDYTFAEQAQQIIDDITATLQQRQFDWFVQTHEPEAKELDHA